MLDNHPYLANPLCVSYAPQYETVDDCRSKLNQRREEVARQIRKAAHEEVKQKPRINYGTYLHHLRNHCDLGDNFNDDFFLVNFM